jgi:5-methylcytosine-specific restriction endonuclease McrA
VGDVDDIRRRAERLERQSRYEFEATVIDAAREVQRVSPSPPRRPCTSVEINGMREEQSGLCSLCGEPLDGAEEVDHKVPVAYGGGNERTNLQLAHKGCNRQKRAQVDPHDLLRYTEDRYRNR